MNLEITENTSLEHIQEKFNKIYPYLWIDFFYPAVSVNNAVNHHHSSAEIIAPSTKLKNLRGFGGATMINVDPETSVAQMEHDFYEMVGLKASVMRKSGSVWVGTIYTGNWTLKNQNLQGEQVAIS